MCVSIYYFKLNGTRLLIALSLAEWHAWFLLLLSLALAAMCFITAFTNVHPQGCSCLFWNNIISHPVTARERNKWWAQLCRDLSVHWSIYWVKYVRTYMVFNFVSNVILFCHCKVYIPSVGVLSFFHGFGPFCSAPVHYARRVEQIYSNDLQAVSRGWHMQIVEFAVL